MMNKDQIDQAGILDNVTVIIRSADERTLDACRGLIEEQGIKKKTFLSPGKSRFQRP
jgi:hypothetical protein